MPDLIMPGAEPQPGDFTDFAALNDFVKSKDPRAKVALAKLSPREMNAYTQWAQSQVSKPGEGEYSRGPAMLAGGALAAGAAPFIGPFLPEIGGIAGAAKHALGMAGTVASYAAMAETMKAMGMSPGTIDAVMVGLGLKGMLKGVGGAAGRAAAGEAAAADEAGAAGRAAETLDPRKMNPAMSDEEVIAAFRNGASARSQGTRIMPGPNVTRATPREANRTGETPVAPGLDLGNTPGRPATFSGPSNLQRGGPATEGRAPLKPGMFGEPDAGPITPSQPSTGGMGSGRTFAESPGEAAGRKMLEDLRNHTGNTFEMRGTHMETNPEFPPGYKKGMSPEQFKQLFDEHVNASADNSAVERARQRLAGELNKPTGPTKTRRRSPK